MVFSAPGIRVVEQDRGSINANLATHTFIYLFGSVSDTYSGEFEKPYIVRNNLNFSTDFGSANKDYVDLIFAQDPNALLQFIPVRKYKRYTLTVPDPITDATTYGITYTDPDVNTNVLSVLSDTASGDTSDTVASDLQTQLNAFDGVTASVDGTITNQINIDLIAGSLGTEVGTTLVTVSDGTTVTVSDFASALNRFALLPDVLPGFLIIPEAFKSFTSSNDRTLLTNTLETAAITLNCVGIIDGLDNPDVNAIIADRNIYGSPRGHLSYFAPYVVILDDTGAEVKVPPSPVISAIWAYYIKVFGPKKSPLGTQKVISGITSLSQDFQQSESEAANPVGVNLLLSIKRSGNVIWGGRTISNNPLYAFCNGRVIMNVINETCETAFLPFIGQSLDIRGGVFHDLRNTGNSVLFRLFAQGALYGGTADEAYLCVCDETNNTPEDLDTGYVRVDLYAKTTPTIERILVTTIKVPISQEF